ncbi:ribonuclease R [Deinococcus budaensis]|uniref:Ribonuclease R n=1 Tax=Deinococcus budaensis TaxID=1665626 RepID=A0A7W8GGD2_9DEIO|nr:ribonuclease R [Deinococcus budaensis]MBB5234973.1 ribonuclease R [Deinococcus budaensis]
MPRAKKERAAQDEQTVRAASEEQNSQTGSRAGRGRRSAAAIPQAAAPETTPDFPTPEATAAAPARRGRKTAAPAEPQPTSTEISPETGNAPADAALSPVVAETLARPRRGRPPRAAKADAAEPTSTPDPVTAEPAVEVPVPEADAPTLPASAPTRAPRRGRKASVTAGAALDPVAAPHATEAAPAPGAPQGDEAAAVEVTAAQTAPQPGAEVPTADAAPLEAPAPSRRKRGRQPKAEASPEVLPAVAEPTDPVLLEVPKPRRSRKPKAAAPAPQPEADPALDEVLGGVEAVAVEEAPAPEAAPALAVTGDGQADTPEPVVDLPHETEDEDQPTVPVRRGRSAGRETATPAATSTATPAPEAPAPGGDSAGESGEAGDPAREMVVAQLRKLGRPIHVRDLERTFTRQMLDRLGDWRDLEALLDDLTQTGEVIRTRKRTYGLPEAMNLVRGRFQASAAGFGFVVPDSGGEDYYVAAEHTMEAWNGDIVLVRMEGRGDNGRGGGPRRGQRGDGSPRASVARIVQRAYKQLVGTLEFSKGHPILKPDDHRARHRILLLPDGIEELHSGARVVSALFWPEHTGEDEVFGQVTRVLGAEDDPETETEAVIVKYGLRGDFPPEVLAQAQAIPTEIPEEALVGRLDLRGFNIFTVDGRDAKDFDDAIHIQPTPEGTFVVGVHIADVSHYVQEGTPLDQEAYARATSVYLPGRVLPMLPEHLSNGVCSLVPYQDRLTLTALVELSAEGDILKVQLAPSVINSKARLTYDEVQAYSEATSTLPEHARHLEGDLHLLLKITSKLRQKRLREGSLDFKMREVKVDVGPDGRMELIPIREETARGMIEDLMLLANKVVAHELIEREIPALFRIHEEPTLQRFQEVTAAIARLGFSFPGGEPTPQAYQAVLKQVRGTPRESVVNTLLLRSMQQAKYAGENLGHFGLAFGEYLHFTSPIRRYPDLLVHRVLKGMLSGELRASSRAVNDLRAKLPAMGDHTSERERKAAEAERDLTKYYQAKWAQENLGGTFPGNVSGVVSSGLFIALDNGVEGKLHISNLDDDYYVYIEDAQMLRGRSGGRTFRLGDAVTVTISQVNPLARQIDFTQETDMDGNTTRPRARRREDREAEKREKLQTVTPSAPRRFTLDDPQAAVPAAPARAAQAGRRPGGREGLPRDGASREGGREGGGLRERGAPRQGGQSGGRARRVITLERPRNEHLRPVNITVQRMYFGDWTVENLPPDDGQGEGGGRGGSRRFDRPERGASDRGNRAPGYSRGASDRGAVRDLNGRPGGQGGSRPPRAQTAAPQPQAAPADTGDADAKRRRRRRGRRGSNGPQG